MTTNLAGADCCSAKPAYRVVLTASPTTAGGPELLFCGHHFRQHRSALTSRRPIVFDSENRLVTPAAALC